MITIVRDTFDVAANTPLNDATYTIAPTNTNGLAWIFEHGEFQAELSHLQKAQGGYLGSNNNIATVNAATGDVVIAAKMYGANDFGPIVRCDGAGGAGIIAYKSGATIFLYRYPTFAELSHGTITPADGSDCSITCNGSSVVCNYGSDPAINGTDSSTQANTHHGLYAFGTNEFSDFRLAVAGGGPTPGASGRRRRQQQQLIYPRGA